MATYRKYKLTDNVYLLRLDDADTRFFEGIWPIPEGITYNAYIITTGEGSILIDGWKREFSSMFIEAIEEVTDLRDIRKIVIHHTEPDHTGSLDAVLRALGNVELLGTQFAKSMLEAFLGKSLPNFKPLKDGEKITLGDVELTFIHTPWLHWPDTAMTYYAEKKILFTCDAFGGYSIPRTVIDASEDIVNEYLPHARDYFANIVAKYSQHVIKAVDKLVSMGIDYKIVAPGHGLVWVNRPDIIVKSYLAWARGERFGGKFKVVIVYSSMYGNVEKMISSIVERLEGLDIELKVYKFTDKTHDNISDVLGDMLDADLIILGASTYEGALNPLMEKIVSSICSKFKGLRKRFIIVSSYGWAASADKELTRKLTDAGMEIIKNITYKGRPGRDLLEKASEDVVKVIRDIRGA
ncbi:MAG: FprA family A-type flavoprotein [Crenarchaeota archaeon]|nr:FprA family A-type flavoprotein [Thermoproteota archaeon]